MDPKQGKLLCVLVASVTSVASTQVFSQTCDIDFETFAWRDVIQKPDVPDTTVEVIKDVGLNPAQQVDMSKKPYSMAGKFLSSVDGRRRYCTAQFVDTNIIVTAAHCVRNKNGVWLDRLSFFPPADRVTPIVDATCAITPSNFKTGTKPFHWPADYAFVVFSRQLSMDFLDLEPAPEEKDQIVETIGFPLNIDNGKVMYAVGGLFMESRDLGVVAVNGEGTGTVIHAEPRFGLGISGGGWLVAPKNNGGRYRILGINATAPGGVASSGARFGACAMKALEIARANCGLK